MSATLRFRYSSTEATFVPNGCLGTSMSDIICTRSRRRCRCCWQRGCKAALKLKPSLLRAGSCPVLDAFFRFGYVFGSQSHQTLLASIPFSFTPASVAFFIHVCSAHAIVDLLVRPVTIDRASARTQSCADSLLGCSLLRLCNILSLVLAVGPLAESERIANRAELNRIKYLARCPLSTQPPSSLLSFSFRARRSSPSSFFH